MHIPGDVEVIGAKDVLLGEAVGDDAIGDNMELHKFVRVCVVRGLCCSVELEDDGSALRDAKDPANSKLPAISMMAWSPTSIDSSAVGPRTFPKTSGP